MNDATRLRFKSPVKELKPAESIATLVFQTKSKLHIWVPVKYPGLEKNVFVFFEKCKSNFFICFTTKTIVCVFMKDHSNQWMQQQQKRSFVKHISLNIWNILSKVIFKF